MRLLVAGLETLAVKHIAKDLRDMLTDLRAIPKVENLQASTLRVQPDVVALMIKNRQDIHEASELLTYYPAMPILAVLPEPDLSLSGTLHAIGCTDIVILSEGTKDFRRALEQLADRGKVGTGKVIAILGGKGGVGTTAVTVNLADAIASRGAPTALVDLNFYLGDVSETVGVAAEPSISWFLGQPDRLKQSSLLERSPKHANGMHIFSMRQDLQTAEAFGAEQVVTFLQALRGAYAYIIVDCGSNFREETLSCVTQADQCVVITSADRLSLAGSKRRINALLDLSENKNTTRVVINRMGDGQDINTQTIEKVFGVPLLGTVRNAWAEVSASIENCTLLSQSAPDAPVTRDIAVLSDQIVGPVRQKKTPDAEPSKESGNRGIFARMSA
jgi:Flp pilus assembly CpaE family ATPase